jgi:RHS repeat-associated protein
MRDEFGNCIQLGPFPWTAHTNYVLTDTHGTTHPFEVRHEDPVQCYQGEVVGTLNPDYGSIPIGNQNTGVALDGSGFTIAIGSNANNTMIGTPNNYGPVNGNAYTTPGISATNTTDTNGHVVTTIWTYSDSNGIQQTIRVDYTTVLFQTNLCPVLATDGSPCTEGSMSSQLPQKLTLPTGKFYFFTWSADGNGDLLRLDLPTGGYIAYTYKTYTKFLNTTFSGGGQGRGAGSPSKHYRGRRQITSRTVNDGTSANTWNYNGSTITDPLGNDEVHNFAPFGDPPNPPRHETQILYYKGSASSGSLLRTINKEYDFDTSTVQQDAIDHGDINIRLKRETTILENGMQSKSETDYEMFQQAADPTIGGFNVTRLNPIEKREFDWGSNAPGNLLRRTDYAYLHTGNQNYLSRNIVRQVTTTTVYDGGGNQVAQTVNEYDNYAHPGQPMVASNAIQHDAAYDTNFIYRGNVTAVSHWRNTDSAMLTSTNQYDDAGNLLSTIDPLGHKTSYDYTDSWGNSSCAPVGEAKVFATTITNALNQSTTTSYNSCTGTLASLTDPNTATTTYTYDLMNRPLVATRPPAGGSTTYTYDDANLKATRSVEIGNGVDPMIAILSYDGVGQQNQSQLKDPEGDVFTETTYDALGRVATVTNPHRAAPSPTDGSTINQYDALGRVIQVAPPDGTPPTPESTCASNNLCTQYSGNVSTVTDQAGKRRLAYTDALGRVVEVDEPGIVPVHANYHALMQQDGNFVLLNSAGTSMWSTGSGTTNAASIFMQDDGNLVTYIFKWQAGVYAAPTPGSYPSSSCSIGTYLVAGQMLPSGKCIVSPHGQYFLLMNTDGNFFIYDWAHGTGTWGPGTQGHPGAYAIFQTDGNLVVYSASGVALWSSGTSGTYAERLDMNDDGRILIWKSAWNSGTSNGQFNGTTYAHPGCDVGLGTGTTGQLWSGQCFVSPNGRFELLMQTDGNMVIYDRSVTPNAAIWSTGTAVALADPSMGLRTLYFYDALNNLYCVEQHGDAASGTGCPATPPGPTDAPVAPDLNNGWRRRLFAYDSLSRLRWASNPESGVISYTYDADGNLLQKTSPAPNPNPPQPTQTVSYCYDELHRVTGKGYGAQSCPLATPVVTYAYDSGANAKGHLTSLTDQAGTGSYNYDIMGRLTTETRTLIGANNASIPKTVSYEYNLDGSLYKLHYPSSAVVTYTPNFAGRTLSAMDGDIKYVTGATYSPNGALTSFVSGNSSTFAGITNSFAYNNRLQPLTMSATTPSQTVYSIGYDFHLGNGDNGNVFGITNYKDQNRNQTFTYDALNRLASAQNTGTDCNAMVLQNKTKYWGNSYGYDAWGNLLQKTITKCGAENLSVTADARNRLHAFGTDYQYDGAGNMTYDATANLSYNFDQENRLTGAAGYTYTYDSDGNRVRKSNGNLAANGTLYWYMTPGVVAESDLAGTLKSEYVFFDGERVARRDGATGTGGVFYYFSDHLKTASVITDSAGVIKAESDYYPWGGELQFINNDSNDYKFTGKKRDAETGLDYFGARYYSNGLGRWVSADWSAVPVPVPYADFGDPQTLNLYQFVGGNPASKADADGHWPTLLSPPNLEELGREMAQATREGAKMIAAAGRRAALGALVRVGVGTTVIVGAYAASPYIQTVGQSNADEIAERDRLDAENAQKLGQARGADEEKSQSDVANERARTNGGFAYENPGHHDPTSPNFVPGKTPLPSDAEAVFNHGVIGGSGGAPGTGQKAFGISDTGEYYRFSGQNNRLHFSGTVKASEVPKEIRKQLQQQLKERLKAKENEDQSK